MEIRDGHVRPLAVSSGAARPEPAMQQPNRSQRRAAERAARKARHRRVTTPPLPHVSEENLSAANGPLVREAQAANREGR